MREMKHLFIINPAAGQRESTEKLEEQIRSLKVDWEIVYTAQAGDAVRFARNAAETGQPVRIYGCGGDGTLNEVVNGAAGFDNAAVTNVPIGSGNDYLKIFGPDNKARFSDIEALTVGPQAAMDLIDCNGRLGIGVVCAGVDARVAEDVDRYKRLPLIRGLGAYILSLAVNVLFKGITRPTKVDAGDFHFEGATSIVCVCSGRYYGGGFMPVGDNMPDDGVIETLIVPKVNLLTFARLVGAYAKGRYKEYPNLIWPRKDNEITVSSCDKRDVVVCVDGEIMRAHEFTVKLSEKKVNFFYPGDLSYEQR